MRRRSQRFERLKFRAWDERACEAARSMLRRLPEWEHAAEGASEEGETGLLHGLGRVVTEAGALESPLAYFALELDGLELRLSRVSLAVGEEAVGTRSEGVLARVWRIRRERYVLRRARG